MQQSDNTRRRADAERVDERIVRTVVLREDGWEIEVEDRHGSRMSYWIAGIERAPSVGTVAHFDGGVGGERLRGITFHSDANYGDATA